MENELPLDQKIRTTNIIERDLPNAGGTLAMGIIAIPFSAGFIGPILAIIALTNAGKARALYNEYPDDYTASSLSRINAGRVCAIVSLSITGLLIVIIALVAAMG